MLQRPERVVLLSAPQAFFGLVFNGWVLAIIIVILTVTAWITVIQRVAYVYTATTRAEEAEARAETEARPRFWARNRTARPLLKGE
jgi:CDP-diacylglycerol--glycerol-3-phosphate 3-phosphatidyltransferase